MNQYVVDKAKFQPIYHKYLREAVFHRDHDEDKTKVVVKPVSKQAEIYFKKIWKQLTSLSV